MVLCVCFIVCNREFGWSSTNQSISCFRLNNKRPFVVGKWQAKLEWRDEKKPFAGKAKSNVWGITILSNDSETSTGSNGHGTLRKKKQLHKLQQENRKWGKRKKERRLNIAVCVFSSETNVKSEILQSQNTCALLFILFIFDSRLSWDYKFESLVRYIISPVRSCSGQNWSDWQRKSWFSILSSMNCAHM